MEHENADLRTLAHDVADDMHRYGMASVTMVQRSPTCK